MPYAVARRGALQAAVASLLLSAPPAWARRGVSWLQVQTPSFSVFGRVNEETLIRVAMELEAFDQLLRRLHTVEREAPSRSLPVYLVPTDTEIRRVRPDGPSVSGFYSAGVGEVFAVMSLDGDAARGRQVMFHEYTHHFMLRNAPSAYPAWLVEGYAEYFSTTRFTKDAVEIGVTNPRIAWLRGAVWSPFEAILGRRALSGLQEDITAFYAQSWLLTHYMMSDPARLARLTRYAAAVAAGGDPVALMPEAAGVPMAALESTLKRYMRALPGQRLPRLAAAAADLKIVVLSRAADDLILENQRLKMGVPPAERPALLAQIRERAARYPGDRLADLTLARAENDFGDRVKAQAILKHRIELDERDVEALQLLGWSCLQMARAEFVNRARWLEEARDWLAKGFAIDPDNPLLLYDYAQTRRGEQSYPSDNIVNVMLRAQALAPQVLEFRLGAADVLMRRGRFEEASVMMAPVFNSPHSGPRLAELKRRFEEAQGRRRPLDEATEGDKAAVGR